MGGVASGAISEIKHVNTEAVRAAKQWWSSVKGYSDGLYRVVRAHFNIDLDQSKEDFGDANKNLLKEMFLWGVSGWEPYIGRKAAIDGTYWVAVVAALVFAWYIGPEVAFIVDYIAMLALETVATTIILSEVVAIVLYYSVSAIAMVTSEFLMAYLSATIMGALTEIYFNVMYGAQLLIQQAMFKQYIEMDWSSSLMDGSMYDWMAGGVALNAVMAGGDLSYGAYPNDPYTKGLMYESRGSDISAAVKLIMPYDMLAGGSMFGLNGNGSSPYHPLTINL